MNKITPKNIHLFTDSLRFESPSEIVSFALNLAEKPIVTTSFGAYSAIMLHACSLVKEDIPVIWCDTGYNTTETYLHAQLLQNKLNLNLEIFTPRYTTAFLNNILGKPDIENPNHEQFSEEVKLEPFQRAMAKYNPDVWFTNLRKGQTSHRNSLDILSFSENGILKVAPFYHFSDDDLRSYAEKFNLPMEFNYYDPVKAMRNRECGIHFK